MKIVASLIFSLVMTSLTVGPVSAQQNQLPQVIQKQDLDSAMIQPVPKIIQPSESSENTRSGADNFKVRNYVDPVSYHQANSTISPIAQSTSSPVNQTVVLESRMLETTSSRGFELGVDSVFFHTNGGGVLNQNNDFATSGRVWIGYQLNPLYSVRSRIWMQEYDGIDSTFLDQLTLIPAPPTGDLSLLTVAGNTELDLAEFEVRRAAKWGRVRAEGFMGLSYAEQGIELNGDFSLADLSTDEITIANQSVDVHFRGAGLNFGFDSVIPFPNAPQFGLVANLRGAVLGGSNNSLLSILRREFAPDGAGNLVLTSTDTILSNGIGGDSMWIGHAQVGLQYERALPQCGGARFVARGLYEFQTWGMETLTFNGPIGVGPVTTFDIDTELYGFTFGVGIER